MSPIAQLPSGIPQLIQSTISLPTYPSILAELIHNAIDAEATLVDCWINPCGWTIRVTDNGYGIDKDELKGGLGTGRGMTSKRGTGGDADHALGFRGQGK
jgi:DNA mismatch repair protein MLH3